MEDDQPIIQAPDVKVRLNSNLIKDTLDRVQWEFPDWMIKVAYAMCGVFALIFSGGCVYYTFIKKKIQDKKDEYSKLANDQKDDIMADIEL